jgi:GTP-binding protein
MFVDLAKITIKAGDGGSGCVSFHREKYVAAGGPDGGDGGRGGSIVFEVADNLSTLADLKYRRNYRADDGKAGGAKNCRGRNGRDLVIRVPRGTLIKDAASGRIIKDMSDDEPFTAAQGGHGGWGNQHFATPTRQIPRFAKAGMPGDELEILLELKLLADVGLLGCPNVGKSTLLSRVSQAKPAIADYHFTTLSPVLGVVSLGEGSSFVMADIPGLIEGASHGVGLGDEFLRHVDRCRLLIHVVDVAGTEGRDPIEDFKTINAELKAYSAQLAERPQIVAGNKSDVASAEDIARFKKFVEDCGYEFFPISAVTGKGLDPLIARVGERLKQLPPMTRYESEQAPEEKFEDRNSHKVTVTAHEGVYFVEGAWLARLINSINFGDYDSMQYFQRVLRMSGVIKELEKAGINEGDTVSIYDVEFKYVR